MAVSQKLDIGTVNFGRRQFRKDRKISQTNIIHVRNSPKRLKSLLYSVVGSGMWRGKKSVMLIRIGWNADPDPGSASASTRIRIQGVKRCRKVKICHAKITQKYNILSSVVEPEPAGAILFSWSRIRWKSSGSGLLLFGLGVLWWKSSDNLTCKI